MMAEEANNGDGAVMDYKDQRLEQLEAGIEQLLDLCARNEIEVPAALKDELLQTVHGVREERVKNHAEYLRLLEEQNKRLSVPAEADVVTRAANYRKSLRIQTPHLQVRIKNGRYTVTNFFDDEIALMPRSQHSGAASEDASTTPRRARQKIETVQNSSPVYKLMQCILKCIVNKGDVRQRREDKILMDGVNLFLDPGKMYLILGGPGSGKSILQKMIAGNLYLDKTHRFDGEVSISGLTPKDVVWTNLVGYIDQIDRLHPFLTVFETCEFAWRCRSGGTHRREFFGQGDDVDQIIAKMDQELYLVNAVLEGLGLTRVKDTFVGDSSKVRGVSGGERKRVTVAEMVVIQTPVICCDEISTGLDAATTFDITRLMAAINKIFNTIKVVSLLQPPPETVANFDELILLSEGRIIYCGPVDSVIEYFNDLGYEIPERMDVADWLQALPTSEGWMYLKEAQASGAGVSVLSQSRSSDFAGRHLTTQQFHEKFYQSVYGKEILEKLEQPLSEDNSVLREMALRKYRNSQWESLKLVCRREVLLWWRDKYQIKAKIGQTLVQGIVFGTLFWQSSGNSASIMSILFQSMFIGAIGAMATIVKQFPYRSIFYKQQDSHFFPTWTYVVARSVAAIPNSCVDAFLYGTIIFFFVGLAHNDGASIANYFIFVLLVFVSSITSVIFFSMYPAVIQTLTIAQAFMSLTAIVFVLFSGFTVQPDVIPPYYIWIYWVNYFAWMLRAMVVNQFQSGKYDEPIAPGAGETVGEATLIQFGFTLNDEPFTSEWVWYGILVSIGSAIAALVATVFFLNTVRFVTGKSLVTDQGDAETKDTSDEERVEIPFTRVDLTFKNIHYTVKSSISDEKLELLKGIDGIVEAGKMTALMGSSGAGKTTLMDVLALRKSSGEIEGEVRLNGHLQEEMSFRRCTGYVEQFDVQTPQLTIRETVEFSAKLRLDETDPTVTPESRSKFVDQVLNMLELEIIRDLQVGSDETGGLSFEQKKRLSIAVEVIANPSILFLDEPTSGLDARAASIVMRGLKRIALSGRAVCATIHQPSVAIFNEFDALLLLKRGGEVVFFGELGFQSAHLIKYLEGYKETPRIQPGENPATWMLTTIGAGSASPNKKPFDYAGNYLSSQLHVKCLERIESICAGETESNNVTFASRYATSFGTQSTAVLLRTLNVYFRSPGYNTVRVMVSAVVALIFASVYASQRVPTTEGDLNSIMNSIFISILFICVYALNSVLGVFEKERDMFYRHKAANMYSSAAIIKAHTVAELPFILASSTIFTVIFYFIMGFAKEADKFFIFYLFVFLASGTYTFTGQMLMSLFRDSETAQVIGSLVIGFSAMFAGVLIRQNEIPTFWIFMYWVLPSHYIFESFFTSQFHDDTTPITASVGSPFYMYLNCAATTPVGEACIGTAGQWLSANYPDFSIDSIKYNVIYLIGIMIATRVITYWALSSLNYRSN